MKGKLNTLISHFGKKTRSFKKRIINKFNFLIMDNYLKIILNLENELSRMKNVSQNVNEQIEYAIGHCKLALVRLRKLVVEKGFPDTESEIRFFKQIKPVAYGKLLFYSAVFELESSKLKTSRKGHREHLKKQLEKVMSYMDGHHV